MSVEKDARLFICARCQRQVIICRDCDRGNIYCSPQCSKAARRDSLRKANQRYQSTFKGKHKHAERQRRYRLRQRAKLQKIKKVTHQGYLNFTPHDSLSLQSDPQFEAVLNRPKTIVCHFCHRLCSPFLRTGFLHQSSRQAGLSFSSWPQGP